MKATFLEADVPLTKTFYLKDGKIDKIGHPQILNYTSHEENFDDIETFFELLKDHAAKGHCFLKGNLTRPLVKEPRAGTTNPNEDTSIELLDIDGIKGESEIESVLGQCKLLGGDYIIQWSASSGVIPERGMSAHVFLLLNKPYAPAILKQYLTQWNLTVPLLERNVGLTKTNNALRWPLDVTTCQNDKLIYIAPPLLKDGVEDHFSGDRITLVKGKSRTLTLPEPFPNAETNAAKAQDKLNELRKAAGLKERPRTTLKLKGNVEYMVHPDRAVVSGVKDSKEFVYLNLNGGDSWGYYHPKANPEFIYNFKNEPAYKTSELLPDYWREVKDQMNQTPIDAEGKIYLAFRDFKTSTYYNGIYAPDTSKLNLAVAKSESQLRSFLQQYGQPVPEFITDWSVGFDPNSDVTVDIEKKIVNTFQPSIYMKMKPRRVTQVPPTIRRVMLHMLGGDEPTLEHLLNSLAVVMQLRCATGTAWVFHGVPGTGKGVFLKNILQPLFGMANVLSKRIREIDSDFNGFMENSLIIWVDEAEQNDFNAKGCMNADIKNFITEEHISIRKMYMLPYEVLNYLNWFLSSNKGHVIYIDPDDRRFNVGVYQGQKIVFTDADARKIEDELMDFYSYLMTRVADRALARQALNSAAKQKMVKLNMAAIDLASEAIREGNLEYFWHALPQDDINAKSSFEQERDAKYIKLLKDIARDEPTSILREDLFTLLEYTIGNMQKTPIKFTNMLKNHKLDIGPIIHNGKPGRGVRTKWKVKPEWKI